MDTRILKKDESEINTVKSTYSSVPVLESSVMGGPEKNQVTWSMEPYCVLVTDA